MAGDEEWNVTLQERLQQLASAAFERKGLAPAFGGIALLVQPIADYQCNGAMAVAKRGRELGKERAGGKRSGDAEPEEAYTNPRGLAEEIAAALRKDVSFAKVDIAGPGFINFVVDDAALRSRSARIAVDPRSGHRPAETRHAIIIDYGGPNVAKAMHVGHLRSAVIGQGVKNI